MFFFDTGKQSKFCSFSTMTTQCYDNCTHSNGPKGIAMFQLTWLANQAEIANTTPLFCLVSTHCQFPSLIIILLCLQLTQLIFQPAWVQKVHLTLSFASLEAFYSSILSVMPDSPTYKSMHYCIPQIRLKSHW